MKFFQKTALVVLSIMYATTIFGAKKAALPYLPLVSEDIWGVIDEFRGENDGVFRETGYIKPYSRLLDSISKYSPAVCAMVVFFLTLIKLPSKIDISSTCLLASVLALATMLVTYIIVAISPLFTKNHQVEEFPERLFIKRLFIKRNEGFLKLKNDEEYISITINSIRDGIMLNFGTHNRPLSDMRPKNTTSSNYVLQADFFHDHKDLDKNESLILFKLEEGKINAYLSDDYLKSENKLHSLPTPEKITSFDFFKKRKMMITSSERGIIQWESERNKKLSEIMPSTEIMQYD